MNGIFTTAWNAITWIVDVVTQNKELFIFLGISSLFGNLAKKR